VTLVGGTPRMFPDISTLNRLLIAGLTRRFL
jgi:hypothetical protein